MRGALWAVARGGGAFVGRHEGCIVGGVQGGGVPLWMGRRGAQWAVAVACTVTTLALGQLHH